MKSLPTIRHLTAYFTADIRSALTRRAAKTAIIHLTHRQRRPPLLTDPKPSPSEAPFHAQTWSHHRESHNAHPALSCLPRGRPSTPKIRRGTRRRPAPIIAGVRLVLLVKLVSYAGFCCSVVGRWLAEAFFGGFSEPFVLRECSNLSVWFSRSCDVWRKLWNCNEFLGILRSRLAMIDVEK